MTQGGNPSKRHLHLYHMTDAAFGMPDQHNLSARIQTRFVSSKLISEKLLGVCLLSLKKTCFSFGIWVSICRALVAPAHQMTAVSLLTWTGRALAGLHDGSAALKKGTDG